jgi:hypothetical protein
LLDQDRVSTRRDNTHRLPQPPGLQRLKALGPKHLVNNRVPTALEYPLKLGASRADIHHMAEDISTPDKIYGHIVYRKFFRSPKLEASVSSYRSTFGFKRLRSDHDMTLDGIDSFDTQIELIRQAKRVIPFTAANVQGSGPGID